MKDSSPVRRGNYKWLRAIAGAIRWQKMGHANQRHDPEKRRKSTGLGPLYDFFDSNREAYILHCLFNHRYIVESRMFGNLILLQDHHNKVVEGFLRGMKVGGNTYGSSLVNYSEFLLFLSAHGFGATDSIGTQLESFLSRIIQTLHRYPLSLLHRIINIYLWYSNFFYVFQVRKPSMVCNVMDYSPYILGASIAANLHDIPVLNLQSPGSNYAPAPFDVAIQISTNREGHEKGLCRSAIVSYLGDRPEQWKGIEAINSRENSLGILLNSFFYEEDVRNNINLVKRNFPAATIEIRYHPAHGESHFIHFPEDWQIRNILAKAESLHQFVSRHKLFFAGGSTVLIEVLKMGKAMIFMECFDRFDLMKCVENGVVYHWKGGVLDISSVNEFYSNPEWIRGFREYAFYDPDPLSNTPPQCLAAILQVMMSEQWPGLVNKPAVLQLMRQQWIEQYRSSLDR